MRRLFFSIAALVTLAPPLRAQTPDAVIARAVSAYKSIRTLRGSFEQTLRNPLTGSMMTARGDFEQQLPDRISVRFTEPRGDRIIVNGETAWLYLPSTNPGQAYKVPAAAGGGSLNITEQFLTSPATRFRMTSAGTAMIGDRATHAITLAPKTPMPEFSQAIVWIDDETGLIRQFEINEPSGLIRRIRLIEATVNAAVDPASFSFTPPKGVQVIDQTGRGGK